MSHQFQQKLDTLRIEYAVYYHALQLCDDDSHPDYVNNIEASMVDTAAEIKKLENQK